VNFCLFFFECSAVALNFGKPVKHVNDTDDFVTIDVHKMCSKTDYLWMTRPPVAWNKLFTNHPPEDGALPIFKYLKKSELQICGKVSFISFFPVKEVFISLGTKMTILPSSATHK